MYEPLSPPPHWRFWGTVGWGVLILAAFALVQLAAVAAAVAASAPPGGFQTLADFMDGGRDAAQNGTVISLASIASTLVGCMAIAVVIALKRGAVLAEYLALRPVRLRALFTWVGILAAFMIAASVVAYALGHKPDQELMQGVIESARPRWIVWVAVIVAAPLFEETFFRGFLFRGLAASPLRPIGAILATAALFAALHVQYAAFEMMQIFGIGLLLGAARASTGSLYTPLALHALVNLSATVMVTFGGE